MNYGVHRNLAIEFQQSMDEVHENWIRTRNRMRVAIESGKGMNVKVLK